MPAMSQQTQFITPQRSVAHITGAYPVVQSFPYVVPDLPNFDHPYDMYNAVIPNVKPARNRRNAQAQRQYRERKKRVEQERDAEVAALKSKVEYLVALLKLRYSHDPSLELQLISPASNDPPTTAFSDYTGAFYAGEADTLLDTISQTSQTLGFNSHTYLPTPPDTSGSSTQRLVNEPTARIMTDLNFHPNSRLSDGSVDVNDLRIQDWQFS